MSKNSPPGMRPKKLTVLYEGHTRRRIRLEIVVVEADCGRMENAPVDEILIPKQPNQFALCETGNGIDVKKPGKLDALCGIVTTRVG